MGFTIGGRRADPVSLTTAVAEYTGLWGWDVLPGARAGLGPDGRPGCSCGGADCPAPGAHPLDPTLLIPAGTTLDEATRAWARTPGASVLLPTGRDFDVIDVPAPAGLRALPPLERMGLPLGPVALAPHGRAWFFVAPGAAADLPRLLYRVGWDDAPLDLRGLGPGRHVTAPPSDHGGLGPVRWLRPPGLETAARPPRARLLLGVLAYACRRAGPS
ncbi:bifunctional DNA primase/polymerase [Streptomyces sp. NBC_01803]|uniref:bifunctional DNA primase/polymerase n=1 Tax=Streptomyces sp. NBC_01803 TaxID=2975946 RepID=UPI002DD82187|nr:bifunctional DNA primase/polymerase [Streptomyces sp. NBC_01803]WSA43990.1 bifunctional DNA primase/polymerase [Streptomyces sp. NBC_01803]